MSKKSNIFKYNLNNNILIFYFFHILYIYIIIYILLLYNFIKQLIRIFFALMEGVNNCNKPAFGLSPADRQEL